MTDNNKENALLISDEDVTFITKEQYLAGVINSIQTRYKHLRQLSKAP